MKRNVFHKMFAAWAKDAEPEEIEQALGEMGKDEDPASNPDQGGSLEKDVAGLKSAMAECMGILKQLVESDKKVHEGLSDEDKLNSLENLAADDLTDPDDALMEKEEHKGSGNLIESEKMESEDEESCESEKPAAMDAAMKNIVKAMKPVLLSITDEKERTKAVDAFVAAAKDAMTPKTPGKNDYAALAKAVSSNASKATDNKPKTMDERRTEQVSTINKYNPHLKKEEK